MSLTAVTFVQGHRSVFPRTPRNTSVYTRHPSFVTATSAVYDTASGLTLKKQNACLHAVRHAVGKKIACIHGLRSEGVNQQSAPDGHINWIIGKLHNEYKFSIGSSLEQQNGQQILPNLLFS